MQDAYSRCAIAEAVLFRNKERGMPIENDEQLREAAESASRLVQEMQSYLGERNAEEGKIRFPYGYIRTASHFRQRVSFLNDHTLQSNIAYTLILSDVLRWGSNRMHLVGTAKEMLAKQIICLMGGVVESTTKHYLRGVVGARSGYKPRTANSWSSTPLHQTSRTNWTGFGIPE